MNINKENLLYIDIDSPKEKNKSFFYDKNKQDLLKHQSSLFKKIKKVLKPNLLSAKKQRNINNNFFRINIHNKLNSANLIDFKRHKKAETPNNLKLRVSSYNSNNTFYTNKNTTRSFSFNKENNNYFKYKKNNGNFSGYHYNSIKDKAHTSRIDEKKTIFNKRLYFINKIKKKNEKVDKVKLQIELNKTIKMEKKKKLDEIRKLKLKIFNLLKKYNFKKRKYHYHNNFLFNENFFDNIERENNIKRITKLSRKFHFSKDNISDKRNMINILLNLGELDEKEILYDYLIQNELTYNEKLIISKEPKYFLVNKKIRKMFINPELAERINNEEETELLFLSDKKKSDYENKLYFSENDTYSLIKKKNRYKEKTHQFLSDNEIRMNKINRNIKKLTLEDHRKQKYVNEKGKNKDIELKKIINNMAYQLNNSKPKEFNNSNYYKNYFICSTTKENYKKNIKYDNENIKDVSNVEKNVINNKHENQTGRLRWTINEIKNFKSLIKTNYLKKGK